VRRKTVSGIMLSLLFIGMLILTFNIQPVKAEPLDFDPPVIDTPSQEPLNPWPGQVVRVLVNVTDAESGVKNVTLLYKTEDGITWYNSTMAYNVTIQSYQGTIPGFPGGVNIYYKIIAYDNAGNCCIEDNNGVYYVYTVIYAIGASVYLTIYSSPLGIKFAVDSVSYVTPWSGIYNENTSVSLVMPEIHTVGDATYYWNQWSDGNTSRSRTVTMNTNTTLTAQYTGPYYQLTVTSSPITGIQFTINGAPKTTPYTEWLPEGSYTLEMPKTHNGYVWSHWLEDGDTNRIKTILLQGTTWTALYEPAPPPVGGKATPINIPLTKSETPTLSIWLMTIILSLAVTVVYVKKRKRHTEIFSLTSNQRTSRMHVDQVGSLVDYSTFLSQKNC